MWPSLDVDYGCRMVIMFGVDVYEMVCDGKRSKGSFETLRDVPT